jgi:hypothetical protein
MALAVCDLGAGLNGTNIIEVASGGILGRTKLTHCICTINIPIISVIRA